MLLKAAICDDEPQQAGMLEKYVAEWAANSGLPVQIKIFSSAEAFRFAWEEEKDWYFETADSQALAKHRIFNVFRAKAN